MSKWKWAIGIALFLLFGLPQVRAGQWTLKLDLHGRQVEGTPVFWSPSHVLLLGRDGSLWGFAPDEARNFSKTSDDFRGYSASEIRGRMQRQFGREFEVSGTGHYLVVHPAGQRDRWAARFEELSRSFVHYFSTRGFRPHEPQFPLVAVVFPRHRDFVRHAAKVDAKISRDTLGYYSMQSNHVLLYDVTERTGNDQDWHINAETIIHEATHQTAFNTGVHSRLSELPAWVGEGLGTMFEAPGVWNSRHHTRQSDRLNRYRLASFKRYAARGRRSGSLAELIKSDRIFKANAARAYASPWELTRCLVVTEPRKYFDYLAKTSSRPVLAPYPPAERLKDFTDVFGDNFTMLDARLVRFISQFK